MRKTLLFFVSLAIVIFSLCSCAAQEDRIVGTPMLKVILKESDEKNDKQFFYIVDDKGHAEKIDTFTPDENVTVFYADIYTDFNCDIENGKVINTLTGTKGNDEQGNSIKADETTAEIMEVATNTIDHDMYEFSVWCSKGKYFVFVKLNVNWQDPCILYSYNTEQKELIELYSWESRDLVGISTDVK
ncbi:MAG: hypothetical protein PUD53_05360 [Oscillospiraceae bacterium]|nr:hypothetical protein [Oscillospiraceae bacterium]